jgi:methyl-accepting chemotaxis protein
LDFADLGQMIGSAVAAIGASQALTASKVRSELREPMENLGGLRQEVEHMTKAIDELKGQMRHAEERIGRAVTDEEFQAYVRTTTEAVNTLTEKVGRATGAIEQWYRTAPPMTR